MSAGTIHIPADRVPQFLVAANRLVRARYRILSKKLEDDAARAEETKATRARQSWLRRWWSASEDLGSLAGIAAIARAEVHDRHYARPAQRALGLRDLLLFAAGRALAVDLDAELATELAGFMAAKEEAADAD